MGETGIVMQSLYQQLLLGCFFYHISIWKMITRIVVNLMVIARENSPKIPGVRELPFWLQLNVDSGL